jgi:hypothetical protein
VTAVALAAFAMPAHARDPDASDPPRVSGPLVGAPVGCEDNGPGGPRETKGQSCTWEYDLAPTDTDPLNDYAAYWVQMEIDPAKGECAMMLMFDVELPDNVRIVSASAEQDRKIDSSSDPVAELVVDGGGSAPVPGSLSQDIMVTEGRERVRMTDHRYSYTWTGSSKSKVMVAVGLQLSYQTLPPEFFYTWSEGQGVGWGSCRPIIVRARPR